MKLRTKTTKQTKGRQGAKNERDMRVSVSVCVCVGGSKHTKNISDLRRLNRSPRKHVVVRGTTGERGFKGGRGGSLSEKFTHTHMET